MHDQTTKNRNAGCPKQSLVLNSFHLTLQTIHSYRAVPHTSAEKNPTVFSIQAVFTSPLQDLKWGRTCPVHTGDASWCCLMEACSTFLPLLAAIPFKGRSKECLPRQNFSLSFHTTFFEQPWYIPLRNSALRPAPLAPFTQTSA